MMQLLEKVLRLRKDVGTSVIGYALSAGIRMRRVSQGLILGLLVLALTLDVQGTYHAVRAADAAELRSQVTLRLNTHTLARFATHRVERESLSRAVEAADQLNGNLVAALAIHTIPDTIYVALDTVPTILVSDGQTRLATLMDTTELGMELSIKAMAPADVTQPISIGYTLVVPEFSPEVAFIENDTGVYASVSWLNQAFTIEAPYYRPIQKNRNPLRVQIGSRFFMFGAPDVTKIVGYDIYAQLAYQRDSGWNIAVPIGLQSGGSYVGLSFQKDVLKIPSLRSLLPF